jgi:hypothetical protein
VARRLKSVRLRLSGFRTAGAHGINPLSPLDIEAWQRLTGYHLCPWEAEAIFAMDQAFCRSALKTKSKPISDRVAADDTSAVIGLMSSFPKRSRKR